MLYLQVNKNQKPVDKTPDDLDSAPSLHFNNFTRITSNQLEETISKLESIDRIDVVTPEPSTIPTTSLRPTTTGVQI